MARLRELYLEALSLEGAVGLNIATRADCLGEGVPELLAQIAERTVLTVELGLQSSNDKTAELINRGHSFAPESLWAAPPDSFRVRPSSRHSP